MSPAPARATGDALRGTLIDRIGCSGISQLIIFLFIIFVVFFGTSLYSNGRLESDSDSNDSLVK